MALSREQMGVHKETRTADDCTAMLIQTYNNSLFASGTQDTHKQFVQVQKKWALMQTNSAYS